MRIIESRSIDNQAGLLGSRLITGTNAIEGAFQSFIVAEDTVVTKVYNSIGIDVTGRLGLTSITLKAGAFISMPKGDYFSSIKLASGSIVAYFTSHGGMSISADAYLSEFLSRTGSSYLEASECVKAHLQQLINIGLLQKASLIMSPSMYEEDLVKSVVPQDGSGDLTFTRASDGTRVNSAGLVEVCPWNLASYSEDFGNVVWTKTNATITANDTTAPNGTTTADKFAPNGTLSTSYFSIFETVVSGATSQAHTAIIYAKAGGLTQMLMYLGSQIGIYFNLSNGQFISYYNGVQTITNYSSEAVGDGWYKYTISISANSGSTYLEVYGAKSGAFIGNYTTADNFFLWGAQLNIGSTAKPYFPTTDRLNVPRLTYQNGGGGCPSLLLEKQSTNLLIYSEQFDQWATNGTTTSNVAISPDGTQNADRLNYTSGSVYWLDGGVNVTNGVDYTYSLYVKPTSIGDQFRFYIDGAFNVSTTITTDSSDWKRYTWTFTASATGSINPHILLGYGYTSQNTLVWGAQLEASSYPTSYIPTTSSSATRVADECKKSGIGALIGGTSGTVFFDIKTNPTLSSSNYKQFCYYVTSGGSQSYLYLDGANKITTNATWGSLFYNTALQPNTRYKVALVFAPNDFALYINGVSVATASSGTPNNNVDLQIGQFNGTEMCEFVFNQYTHFPTRLTNAELASLTTL